MKKIFSLFLLLALTAIQVMAYEPIPDKLYIIGGATRDLSNPDDKGWDNPIEMTKLEDGTFCITREFGGDGGGYDSQFKFVTSNGDDKWGALQFGTAIDDGGTQGGEYKGVDRNQMYDLLAFGGSTGVTGDHKFYVRGTMWHTIHVDIVNMKMSTWPVYIYPVGNGCEVGWNTGSDIKLTETSFGSGIYTGELELKKLGDDPELKFNCARDYSVFIGPKYDAAGQHDISGTGTYDILHYQSNDHKFWVLDQGFGKFDITLDVPNEKMYITNPITIKAQLSVIAKEAMENEINIHTWFTGESVQKDDFTMEENDGWYSAVVHNVYKPINFLIYGKDWHAQTVDMENSGSGYDANKCVYVSSRKTDNHFNCYHNDGCELISYTANLAADVTEGSAGLTVTFTPSITPNIDVTPKYYINGVETTLNNNQYTFNEIGYYKVKVVYSTDWDDYSAEQVIRVTKDVNFKVHLTSAAKEEFGMDVYFRYWMWYDGYDHAAIVKMTETQDGDWYEATIPALNNVKFLLKNTDGAEYWDNTKQTIDMTNSEAGFIEDACFEMTNEKVEEKFKCNDLPTCEYTSYEVTLTVDKDVCKEGEIFTFTPGITGYKESVTFSYTINGEAAELLDNKFTPTQFGEYTVKVSTIIQGEEYYATKIVKCTRDITLYVYFEQCAKDKWGADNLYMHYWMNYGGYDHATDVKMAATDKADWYKTEIATAYPVKFLLCDNATCDLSGEHTANVEGKDNAGYTNDAYFILDEYNNYNVVTPVEASAMELTPIQMTVHWSSQAEGTWEDKDMYLRYWMRTTNPETQEEYDHTAFVALNNNNHQATVSILPLGGVKVIVQSCNSGYGGECVDGHWTNALTNNETGYSGNQEFIVKDNNAGGHVLEEFVEDELKIHFTADGFSTVCWNRIWSVTEEEALVYVGTYNEENSTLDLERVVDGIVPAEAGVVLYSQSMAGRDATIYPSDQTPSNYYSLTNSLKGTLVATNRNTDVTTYVLAYTTDEPQTMLHQYKGDAIPANKAYLEIGGSASAPARIRMVMPKQQPTELMEQQMNMPIRKIMQDGHLYIIKYGQHFTLQGQEVK